MVDDVRGLRAADERVIDEGAHAAVVDDRGGGERLELGLLVEVAVFVEVHVALEDVVLGRAHRESFVERIVGVDDAVVVTGEHQDEAVHSAVHVLGDAARRARLGAVIDVEAGCVGWIANDADSPGIAMSMQRRPCRRRPRESRSSAGPC